MHGDGVLHEQKNNQAAEWARQNPHLFLTNAERILEYALQPIIDSHTGTIYGFEALIRNFDQFGHDTPIDVFNHAFEIGCLRELELALRRKAIEKFASLHHTGTKLFLNVDPRLLEEEGFLLPETMTVLLQHEINPARICFEVSETSAHSASGKVISFAKKCRKLGFSVAMDDYGTGYSQLKAFYEFEPDILKVDRFFIASINGDSRKRLMVASLVELAHVLGIRIVAEGVETEEEMQVCREIGCDLVQGFLIARPSTTIDPQVRSYPVKSAERANNQMDVLDTEVIRQEIKQLVTIRDDAKMSDVLQLLRGGHFHPIIPVVNAVDEPRGLILEADIRNLIYMPFGQDLLKNPALNNHLEAFIHSCPVVDLHSRLEQLVERTAEEDQTANGVIITKNGKYYGLLTTNALLKIANQIRMRAAENQNPLTKLPGNATINAHVMSEAVRAEADRSFCYIDFDNFKPFNDTYGFRMGDRALLLFSELLKKKMTARGAFVGHVGGDDFFLAIKHKSPEEVEQKMIRLKKAFSHQAESLYDQNHREAGFILSRDRHGIDRQFPLLDCSIAVLHLPAGLAVESHELLGRQIAKLKKEAKNSEHGVVVRTFGDDTRHFELRETDELTSKPNGQVHRLVG